MNSLACLALVGPVFFAPATLPLTVKQGGVPQFTMTSHAVPDVSKNLVAADVNGDGNCDVVTGASNTPGNNEVWCFLGDGAGGFSTLTPSSGDGDVFGIATSDLDGDGRPDVAVSNGSDGKGRVDVFLGNGQGGFALIQSLFLVDDVNSIALADWNLDGITDAAGGFFFGGVGLMLGTGTGTLTSAGFFYGGTAAPESLAFGDMDADGKPDIVVAGHSYAGIHRNLGTSFGPIVKVLLSNAWEVSLGDLDLDGSLDLYMGSSPLVAIRGDGAGGMFPATPIGASESGNEGAIVDIDRDGMPDLVYNAASGSNVKYARGLGGFAFDAPMVLAPGGNQGLAICDLDADGQPDMVATGPGVKVYRNLTGVEPSTNLYGSGTPGCLGTQGVSATGPPVVGNAAFGVVLTNAPLTALGLAIVSNVDDAAGSDPFGLGVLLHCDLFASTEILTFDVSMLTKGAAHLALPIPNAPALAGSTYFTQFLSLWPADSPCTSSVLGLSSSKVLRIRIL